MPAASSGSATATRPRHEGLVGWITRNVTQFAAEVVGIFRCMGATFVRVVPGSSRARRAGGRIASSTTAATKPWLRTRLRSRGTPRTATQVRIAAERREQLRSRARVFAGAGLVILVIAAWLIVPASDAFRIRHVEVTGTRNVVDLEVRERVDSLLDGKTVFTVDEDALVERMRELPFVRSARVERHLPGGLQLHITEYRPLALAYGDGEFWLVAPDGRVLAKADGKAWRGRIPTIELQGRSIKPGMRLDDEPALQVLDVLPAGSTLQFDTIRTDEYRLEATLRDGVEVRFGRPDLLLLKLVALERTLQLSARHDEELLYVDVSVPAKPARCERDVVACHLPRGKRAAAAEGEQAAAPTTPEEIGGDEADVSELAQ